MVLNLCSICAISIFNESIYSSYDSSLLKTTTGIDFYHTSGWHRVVNFTTENFNLK